MFIVDEDWNDEPDSLVLSNTVLKSTQKTDCSIDVKSKRVGKKSLLRTLQTLGSVPEWKNEGPQEGCDSDTETTPLQTKRKKKRSKRRRQGDEKDKDDGDVHLVGKDEKPAPKLKKNVKFGSQKIKKTDLHTEKIEKTPAVKSREEIEEDAGKLNRKQWRNRMKNKKRCKNKYRQDKPEQKEITEGTKEQCNTEGQLKENSQNNSSKKVLTQTPAQKTKKDRELKPHEGKPMSLSVDTQTVTGNKSLTAQGGKHKKSLFESSHHKSKQDTAEPQREIADDHPTSAKRPKLEMNNELRQKREKLRRLLSSQEPDNREGGTEPKEEDKAAHAEQEVKEAIVDRSATLRARMEQRLEAARFRYINELLYTTSSGEAKRMFKQDPQAFGIYHKGYTAQVQRWPANPVDAIIAYIRRKPASLVVADFGCGDCKIACSVKNKVHSFDLAPVSELVTVCDMANVPLDDGTVDIAVFCLSLMGTNLTDFLVEANRVLVMGGVLQVAEVASRFDDVRRFLTTMATLGFKLVSKDTENSHFYTFEFIKTQDAPENMKKLNLQLRPCVYKKR
ncbi:ribosomal RNA-processing protein 8 [Lampris incognitus]|uniref:ribosomal RNA-processing protein 8 n=1 Tax=Lampris incognitus TaxID=2546036 RepID=UPI0024B5B319|nr:ribosomal RNA-processing protein 8 [Lampris incognitus]XP_056139137.1 ribosomal RNA-processing protein 8 [Lampris incognitus]